MPFIHVDPNTLQIKISTNIDDPYIPSEETIAIKMFAQSLVKFRDEFVNKEFNPKVDQLMKMVLEFNAKYDKNIAKQLKDIQEQRKAELKKQMTPKEKKLKVAKQVVEKKVKSKTRRKSYKNK